MSSSADGRFAWAIESWSGMLPPIEMRKYFKTPIASISNEHIAFGYGEHFCRPEWYHRSEPLSVDQISDLLIRRLVRDVGTPARR
jgi:hypothetical protein